MHFIPCSTNDHPFIKVKDVFSKLQVAEILNFSSTPGVLTNAEYTTDDMSFSTQLRSSNICWLEMEKFNDIYDTLNKCIQYVNTNYFKFSLTYLETCQYTEYHAKQNGCYQLHQDASLKGLYNDTRKLSFSILLNHRTEFEGGNLVLNISPTETDCDLNYNEICFFPSMFPHQVKLVTQGIRKSLVGWIHGPNFI